MIKKTFFILLISIFLLSCTNIKDQLSLKKKDTVDEFLIQKKNPLVLPPEYSKLPTPNDSDVVDEDSQNIDFEKILEKNEKKNGQKNLTQDNTMNSLEKSISDLIKKK
jgi:hypothetical protein